MQIPMLEAGFREHGCCALSALLTPAELDLLRRHCDARRAQVSDELLCESDCVLEACSLPGERHPARKDAAAYLKLRAAVYDDDGDRDGLHDIIIRKLAAVAAAALGSPPLLFNEHFVAKPARVGGPFRWHTDAAHQLEAEYALSPPDASDHPPYVSIWCALDDLNDDNGPLVLLPSDVPQPPDALWHRPADDETEAWLEAHADALTTSGLRAGDVVLFSSRLWHLSRPNVSERERRVFYAQFSSVAIGGSSTPLALAVPTQPEPRLLGQARVRPLPPLGRLCLLRLPESLLETIAASLRLREYSAFARTCTAGRAAAAAALGVVLPAELARRLAARLPTSDQLCRRSPHLVLPAALSSVGHASFRRCTALSSIGPAAFHGCQSLVSIALPPSCTRLGPRTFANCHSLAAVSLLGSITTIKQQTFAYCIALASVELPAGLTTIDASAFCGCLALQSIKLPASVWQIHRTAFEQCTLLDAPSRERIRAICPEAIFDAAAYLAGIQLYGRHGFR